MVVAFLAAFACLVLHSGVAHSTKLSNWQSRMYQGNHTFAYSVASCPGYSLSSMQKTSSGYIGQLNLAGPECNAYGYDIKNLTLKVVYDSNTRLHVNIYDTANLQFTIPNATVAMPEDPLTSYEQWSDLIFNYDSLPFAFWITRRSDPWGAPVFDTRKSSLPPTPIPPVIPGQNRTALDGFSLVFEDQYLQLTSALPYGANIYGLGEVIASSGFRRDVGTNGGVGSIETNWARDASDPIDQNEYGIHPVYMEHRYNENTGKSQTHGVYLHSAAGADILLLTPPNSNKTLIEYRMIGGTLDFYFFSGPTPKEVIQQYGELIGKPKWQPAWGFGFHLCRYGYKNLTITREQVLAMRAANIPLEVMWNDIDIYHSYRDFTTDPARFPISELQAFIAELTANNQHYIPIVDAGTPVLANSSDVYYPFEKGMEMDVFIKNPDNSLYIGQVWPGYTAFPDWFAPNTQSWWTEALYNWSTYSAVNFSGLWLDMNEVSSFCNGSCGTGANLNNTTTPFITSDAPSPFYPEGYNQTISGPSGNITINGTLTYGLGYHFSSSTLSKRGSGAGDEPDVNLNSPPYAINNGNGPLWVNTIATNATHYGGYYELDTHNMWGMMEEMTTYKALATLRPTKRPFLISRSTYASAGKWTGHWLGDNYSKWQYLYLNIQGVLQFQIFQIPFVGADTCGFHYNTDEELCNRWMELSAWMPFYRNHNDLGTISQEPYRWDTVANSSRSAIYHRYALLPYWYTLFADASRNATPPIRALFYEFPDEPELFSVDRQWMVGKDLLVTPVLTPNVTYVDGIFPGRGKTVWRNWYTHDVVNYTIGANTTLDAPLNYINVHVRDGAAVLTYTNPGYTIAETMQSDYSLLVHLTTTGTASGNAYMDDGETLPPTPYRDVYFEACYGKVLIWSVGDYAIYNKLTEVVILVNDWSGLWSKVIWVQVDGQDMKGWTWDVVKGELILNRLSIDLNKGAEITWG